MRIIAHISDLHFGYNDPVLATALIQALDEIKPHVVVVSGDLVEHATEAEFKSVRDFLEKLPGPQIIVPGNHDLPFYNLWRRFTEGLTKYRQFITDDPAPTFIDDEIAIVGADSAHLWPVKGGKITDAQLDDLLERFATFPAGLIRVLVTHHPFDLPEPSNPYLLIGHSRRAVSRLAPVVDILLAGHVHLSSSGSTSTRYKMEGHAMVFVQAGTAISDRNKGEANSLQRDPCWLCREARQASDCEPVLLGPERRPIRADEFRRIPARRAWLGRVPATPGCEFRIVPDSGCPVARLGIRCSWLSSVTTTHRCVDFPEFCQLLARSLRYREYKRLAGWAVGELAYEVSAVHPQEFNFALVGAFLNIRY